MTKQYIHANGHPIWGSCGELCSRRARQGGELHLTDHRHHQQVEAAERNRILAEQLKRQSDRTTQELQSAAAYMSSIMPTLTGKGRCGVALPASPGTRRRLLDYTWIDDDHLLVLFIDVSGHGIEPALLSVSVHNMIPFRIPEEQSPTDPGKLLTELNRLFQMDQHSGHYFTMWWRLRSVLRTLRYAQRRRPPALAFDSVDGGAPAVTELSLEVVSCRDVRDTVYVPATRPFARIPDADLQRRGVSADPADGRRFALEEFKNLATRLASSPKGSIDELVAELRARTATGGFEDDCSLIGLRFN